MEDTKIVVCRLCLNFTTFDECQILDTVSKDMLTFIMPETDLDISHDPKICQTCYKNMLRCYRFKSNYNKDIKTDTKKKLDTEGSEMISIQVEEVESKCNFCSSSIDDESREEFSNHKTYFTEVLQKYLPERNLSSKALFCKKCLDDLTSQFTFITKCTDTENKLKDYRLTHGTNSEGKLNLYEALQQILCKEDTDLITAIKTDGDMSCEDLFEEANNEVPFPEVDVKTETLNMEEVDIKSEPYDEESIITSESEGSITGSERHLEKSQAESFDLKESAAHDDYKDHSENPLKISQFNVEIASGSRVFKAPVQIKRSQQEAQQRALKKAKLTKDQRSSVTINKRSIGVQVCPKDLIQTCSIGIQVDIICCPPAIADSDVETVTSSTASRKKKFKPRILRKTAKGN